ncbi:oxidoreductase-like domain-containing protein [Moraxella catarrhalis]|uniref:oxidoreductase-like domain-containing protein n=2 Tax=Moraxella catarrhalis TaxID=480 RepID=UPI0007E337DB|nr:oxidoreductase-like domain-containing protein [Moraxella catarrhalis]
MMSQSDFNEMLLPKPEYPEAWECCGSECGEYCVYEIYQRDKIDYDAQQKRLKEFLDQKNS